MGKVQDYECDYYHCKNKVHSDKLPLCWYILHKNREGLDNIYDEEEVGIYCSIYCVIFDSLKFIQENVDLDD